MGEFTAVLVPSLTPAIKLVAIAVLVSFTALQWAGLRLSSRFQEWTTAIKFLAFLALVAACFTHAASSPVPAAAPAADLPKAGLVGLVVALQSVAITFGGWQSALYFTEEDRDPRRNLPRSMIGGVAAVILIYLLVNLALLAVLPVPELAGSTLPAADAAKIIFGGRGAELITLLSLISLPPLVNAIMMIGTRILFAMGRDGLVWGGAAKVNPRGTPVRATLVTTGVAVALIATGTFQKLVAVASFFLAANYCACCVALVILRRREPLLPRPFRAWGYPWSAAIVVLGAVAFLGGVLLADTRTALLAIALLAGGLLVSGWLSRRDRG
jgi:APA family basic amino acid/polyamine antiporter